MHTIAGANRAPPDSHKDISMLHQVYKFRQEAINTCGGHASPHFPPGETRQRIPAHPYPNIPRAEYDQQLQLCCACCTCGSGVYNKERSMILCNDAVVVLISAVP